MMGGVTMILYRYRKALLGVIAFGLVACPCCC